MIFQIYLHEASRQATPALEAWATGRGMRPGDPGAGGAALLAPGRPGRAPGAGAVCRLRWALLLAGMLLGGLSRGPDP